MPGSLAIREQGSGVRGSWDNPTIIETLQSRVDHPQTTYSYMDVFRLEEKGKDSNTDHTELRSTYYRGLNIKKTILFGGSSL